jgi:hypothetical protein
MNLQQVPGIQGKNYKYEIMEVIEMPRGQGMGMGRGTGKGSGTGGMGGNRRGGGPGGNCICPKCAEKVVHQQGVPCYSVNCPKCGAKMMRE